MRWRLLCWLGVALLAAGGPGAQAAQVRAEVVRPATEALFSPWDDVEAAIIARLGRAVHSVHVQAYLLTSRPITQALLTARRRGVEVEVLADGAMAASGADVQLALLAAAGIPVWLETRYAAAHNKILLIDAGDALPVLITGSYNFTWSAQARNAENVLILAGDRALAQRYLANWQRHRGQAIAWAARSDGALKARQPEKHNAR